MTLRSRLLVTTVALTAAGLFVAGVATYHFLGGFLTDRVDQQVRAAVPPIAAGLLSGARLAPGIDGPAAEIRRAVFPDGAYAALLDPDGAVLDELQVRSGSEPTHPPTLPGVADLRQAEGSIRQVPSSGGGSDFRLLSLSLLADRTLVVAIPLTEVDATTRQLLLIEVLVALVVLASTGFAAAWLVRRDLRPLERMTLAADAIAAGERMQRVSPDDSRTEVGRLGGALNRMLVRIEEAFALSAASEERLRRFVADASHELRSPLTSIRGYAELFRRGAAEHPGDLAITMQKIEQEGARLGLLVDELLLLAHLDEGMPLMHEPVDLAALTEQAVDAAGAVDPSRLFTLDADGPVLVNGDEAQLRRVLDNLLSNAIRHTPTGTRVHTRVVDGDERAVVEVSDNGGGIPRDHADRVFERFHRVDPGRTRGRRHRSRAGDRTVGGRGSRRRAHVGEDFRGWSDVPNVAPVRLVVRVGRL